MSSLFEENIQTYSDELEKDIEKYGVSKIGTHITSNLKNELREYQEKALQHYLKNEEIKEPKRHLMFNMATGSGKTMIMAALILDCYKKGYNNFIFFVNSTAILEKTKINFADPKSSKYLYSDEIIIDSKRVDINIINNLVESEENAINIYFSTVQGLFSLFTNERENSITLDDLKGKKLVFLADEAHHLNASTKAEKEDELSWETIIKQAYNSNPKNLMYEFSATIPKDKNVLEKYRDIIVFKYDLRKFCNAGYSKRILLSKYENRDIKIRFLGVVLLSLYREILANDNKISLKPVILFKSETIKDSQNNKAKFESLIENLTSKDIEEFYLSSYNNPLFLQSKEYFISKYGNSYENTIVNLIKNSFKKEIILDVNEKKDAESKDNQLLLNSLEDKDNNIRVIFAVDKLNEGWDVLNLFDIVRLGEGQKTSRVTTQEAQLIGRGARYFPFGSDENKYIRKFDDDLTNPLSVIEQLSYHTTNDVDYIENLNKSMVENGLFVELEEKRITLKPTKKAKDITSKYNIYYITNKRYKKDFYSLFDSFEKTSVEHKLRSINIPLFSNDIINSDIFKEEHSKDTNFKRSMRLKECIDFSIFQKAFNKTGLKFSEILTKFGVKSRAEFYEYLSNLYFLFDKEQKFNIQNSLSMCEYIINNLQKIMLEKQDEYEVSDFNIEKLDKKAFEDRVIVKQKLDIRDAREWMYYDKYSHDSNLEIEFVEFIESRKMQIDAIFKEWIIFRNDGFREFKIFDNRKDGDTYGLGFEPDFIFFGIKKDEADKGNLTAEYIFEPKGGHLSGDGKGIDSWKETLLEFLSGEYSKDNSNLTVIGFPFFSTEKSKVNQEFLDKFNNIIK